MKIEPEAAGMDEARLERITGHFGSTYVDTGKIAGCQITVVRGGHVAYHRSLGLMDRERALPMADDAIFRIYSMTKPIASLALMQLYERGHVPTARSGAPLHPPGSGTAARSGWSAKTRVLPDPGRRSRPVPMNMRDVLLHTTGLPGGLFPDNPIDAGFAKAPPPKRSGSKRADASRA